VSKNKKRKLLQSRRISFYAFFVSVLFTGTVLAHHMPSNKTEGLQGLHQTQNDNSRGVKLASDTKPVTEKKPAANSSAQSNSQAATAEDQAKPVTARATSNTPQVSSPAPDTYQINEQFSGGSLNSSLWQAMTRSAGYRNSEEQDYLPSQATVANGKLQITASRDANGNWHSAEINSKWAYTYGEFEVRLALSATGPGVWPAAWMMGTTDPWPDGGEIDMFEHINSESTIYATIHGGGSWYHWQLQRSFSGIDVTQFHTYKIVKQPNYMSWWVDGVMRGEWRSSQVPAGNVWPYENHKNFALLNLAIGGSWPGPSNAQTPDNITMFVDYFSVKNGS
jgi:beta-glucanase (GH16 family)